MFLFVVFEYEEHSETEQSDDRNEGMGSDFLKDFEVTKDKRIRHRE